MKVTNNKRLFRFETEAEGKIAFISYKKIADKTFDLQHTEVPEEIEGKGIGTQLVKQTLELIKAEGKKIIPSCSFVADYVKQHPEYESLLK